MPPPLKLAIIGGGPSAFYVASRLLSLIGPTHPQGSKLRVHIYDRLWSPHGLVRYGVAPDHPEVKNCTHKFDETALDPRFEFFGNVDVQLGSAATALQQRYPLTWLTLPELYPHYTHILFSIGCGEPKPHPTLLPSSLCSSALDWVHWYTHHPLPSRSSLSSLPKLSQTSHISIIGHGNVSLDVARILLTPPSLLAKYDIPEPVMEELRSSRVRHVSIIGRRGWKEASFTNREVREMLSVEGTAFVPLEEGLMDREEEDGEVGRQKKRMISLLKKGSKNKIGTTDRSWSLEFFKSPVVQTPNSTPVPSDPIPHNPTTPHTTKSRLTLDHTTLDASSRAVSTGVRSTVETDHVVTSLGYRVPGYSLPSFASSSSLSTSSSSTAPQTRAQDFIPNQQGRILSHTGRILKNVYVSGWASTGARGVLASTMMDAYGVAERILGDHLGSESESIPTPMTTTTLGEKRVELLNPDPDLASLPAPIQNQTGVGMVVNYKDWKRIDEEEVRRAKELGLGVEKERERMGTGDVWKFLGW